MSAQRPLELILARNLLSSLSTPGGLLGEEGKILFFNEAAGALLGRSFEDTTGTALGDWTAEFGPFDSSGEPIPFHQLPMFEALREHRPHHDVYRIRTHVGELRQIAATVLPVGRNQLSGIIVMFWPADLPAGILDGGVTITDQAGELR
jgi:PAS domain-containing protein